MPEFCDDQPLLRGVEIDEDTVIRYCTCGPNPIEVVAPESRRGAREGAARGSCEVGGLAPERVRLEKEPVWLAQMCLWGNAGVATPARLPRGGIIIAAADDPFTLSGIHTSANTISATITMRSEGVAWTLTCVYGPQGEPEKVAFIEELK
jgi:hypothetical protein